MAYALIELSGAGQLRGVWVADVDRGRPDLAFFDDIEQLNAERLLGEAATTIEAGDLTWSGFLRGLHERQNLITVQRLSTRTSLTPEALLAELEDLWPLRAELAID